MHFVIGIIAGAMFGISMVCDKTLVEITRDSNSVIPLRSSLHARYLITMCLASLIAVVCCIYFWQHIGGGRLLPAFGVLPVAGAVTYFVGRKIDNRIKQRYALRRVKP